MARKIGRNEPCWCGSGKKYKRCHLESDRAEHAPQVDTSGPAEIAEWPDDVADLLPQQDPLSQAGWAELTADLQDVDPLADLSPDEIESLAEHYDAAQDPDPETWLAADQQEKLLWIAAYHRLKMPHEIPDSERPHYAVHEVIENQVAMGDKMPARRTLDRLQEDDGLSRHESIHALGEVLAKVIFESFKTEKGDE